MSVFGTSGISGVTASVQLISFGGSALTVISLLYPRSTFLHAAYGTIDPFAR